MCDQVFCLQLWKGYRENGKDDREEKDFLKNACILKMICLIIYNLSPKHILSDLTSMYT